MLKPFQNKGGGSNGKPFVRSNLQRKSTKLMLDESVSRMAEVQSSDGQGHLSRFVEVT